MKNLRFRRLLLFIVFVLGFTSCGGGESSGLLSPIGAKTTRRYLVLHEGSYRFHDGTFAGSCLAYLNSSSYENEGDGTYWIDPLNSGAIEAQCDMTSVGGGWTLATNRRGGVVNAENCGSSLNSFFQSTCGDVSNIGYNDSYNIGDSATREAIITSGEWRFLQYNSSGVIDADDAYILHNNTSDLFFDSISLLNKTPISSVCDGNNLNCDNTDVYHLWVGNEWFSSSYCNASIGVGPYNGNYGYCHNGISSNYLANSLFGNRAGYNETKLWNHSNGSRVWQERIWVR